METIEEVDGLLTRRTPMGQPAADTMNHLPLDLFDEIEIGLIVCDAHGRIRFSNQAAAHELVAGGLLVRSDGHLRTASGTAGDLAGAQRLAAQRSRRSLVRLVRGGDRLMVSVLPFGPEQPEGRNVLVMLGRREPCSELGLEMLAASYGLTLAERRVLAALVREASPREIAARHDVELSTVRTQIQAIRIKLGTRNIEGVLLRAAQVPPMASALRAVFGAGGARAQLAAA